MSNLKKRKRRKRACRRWNKTKEIIQDIYTTLGTTVGDKATEYEHRFEEGHNEWVETVNREEHLQAIIEWAMQTN